MKNKSLLYSITLVSFALFSCAGESKDESMRNTTTESIDKNDGDAQELFTELEKPSTELTTEQLEAFELRAIQKFYDFTDFIKVISNNQIDKDLRAHSIQLSTELFISDSIQISDTTLMNKSELPVKLIDFLKRIKPRSNPISIQTISLDFTHPLNKDTSNNYSGIMESEIMIKNKIKKLTITVNVIEIQKDFGENSQSVMEVRLGNIY